MNSETPETQGPSAYQIIKVVVMILILYSGLWFKQGCN